MRGRNNNKKGRQKMNRAKVGFVMAVMMAGLTATSHADRRSYVWTYESITMPAGMAEGEYYLTAKVPDTGASDDSTWQHQVELEYGLLDNWDISMYQMWKQTYESDEESEFNYEGFKLRSRYKLTKTGDYIIDPLIYAEYIMNAAPDKADVVEAKLVLAKDIGNFNIAYNQIIERALEGDADTEHGYAAGISYDIVSAVSLGLEAKGSYSEVEHAVGPVISVETEKIWLSLGMAAGLNDNTDDLQVRMITGFSF
jgi:hypothetical protein